MATIKTSDGDVELFGPSDIYRYDVDNRPLRNLIDNDDAINTELEATTAEVQQARTGLQETYASLDARLDDLELAAGYPQKQIAYAEFMARAQAWRSRYASGMMFPLTDVHRVSDILSSKRIGSVPVPLSGDYAVSAFSQLLLRDESATYGAHRVFFGNGNNLRYNSSTGVVDFLSYRSLWVNIFGFHIPLWNERGGPNPQAQAVASEVYWELPAAPAANGRVDLLWIEVWFRNVPRTSPSFYKNGAIGSLSSPVTNPDDVSLRGNVGFYGGNNGDYFQLCHRLRVSTVANPDTNPFGMSDQVNVLAQGNNSSIPGSPTSYNVFKSCVDNWGDPGAWIAGDGSSGAKTELGTIDGYVWALPIALVFRRNTGQWTITNQNGTKTSGGTGSWSTPDSGRPDGFYHDKIEPTDVVPIAACSAYERMSLMRILDESFDRLLRGELHTKHGFLDYTAEYEESSILGNNEPVGGSEIVAAFSLATSAQQKTRQFKEDDGATLMLPSDFQRLFSAQTEPQAVGFTINLQTTTGTPSNFAAVSGNNLSLKSSGQSVGNSGTAIYDAPLLWWSGSKKPVALTAGWSGLGTAVLSATLDTGDPNYSATGTIVGLAKIIFPAMKGFHKANKEVVNQTYTNPSAVSTSVQEIKTLGTSDRLLGPTGMALDATYFYICDALAHKAWKVNRSTLAVSASFGVYGVSGSDNTHLNGPAGIAVDGSGNVFVADASNHRVVKLNSSMAYQGQFGTTNTPGTDNSHLNTPEGCCVDGSGNIYISDTLNFRIMKVSSDFSYLDVFGVVGVSMPDVTHCILPRNQFFGDDGYVYIADRYRILILNPSTMEPVAFFMSGYTIPVTTNASVMSVNPYSSINKIMEDSNGNKYALTSAALIGTNHVGYVLTKYDSSWGFSLRYGAAWDADGATFGGINAGTKNGLVFPHDFCMDEPNDTLHIIEANQPSDSVNMAQSGVVGLNVRQNRIISIKMSDLTLRQVRYSNATVTRGSGTSGAATAYDPVVGLRPAGNHAIYRDIPELNPVGITLDSTNHYVYIAYCAYTDSDYENTGWVRIEKWSCSSTDPNAWTYVNYFGSMQQGWSGSKGRYINYAWTSSAWDSTRMLHLAPYGNTFGLTDDGAALYIADNHTIIKLNTSSTGMSYVGRFGFTTVPGGDNGHLHFTNAGGLSILGQVRVMCASPTDANGRIYVLDNGNQRLMILKDNGNFNTSGSPSAYSAQWTNSHIAVFPTPMAGRSYALTTGAGKLWFKENGGTAFEVDVSGSKRDTPSYVDGNASTYATIYMPMTLVGYSPEIGANDFFGISKVSGGNIFWTDCNTDQLACASAPDYCFIGKAGVAGASGSDKASWMRPTGIAVDGTKIYLCDYVNARVLVSSHYLAYVEPKVGRTEFLVSPEVNSSWYGYARFAPLQGVYQRGKPTGTYDYGDYATRYPRLTGKNMLVPPTKMLVTTMGQGTSEGLSNDPGVVGYANCIQRLPLPIAGFDEKTVTPMEFSVGYAGMMMNRAHYMLPILNTASNFRGTLKRENESWWQRNTLLSFSDLVVTANALKGGLRSIIYIPGAYGLQTPYSAAGPISVSFSCSSAPAYRYVAIPFLVVVEGEILLAVRVQCYTSSTPGNEIGESINDVVELYRPVGHPMVPHHGETDDLPVIV